MDSQSNSRIREYYWGFLFVYENNSEPTPYVGLQLSTIGRPEKISDLQSVCYYFGFLPVFQAPSALLFRRNLSFKYQVF